MNEFFVFFLFFLIFVLSSFLNNFFPFLPSLLAYFPLSFSSFLQYFNFILPSPPLSSLILLPPPYLSSLLHLSPVFNPFFRNVRSRAANALGKLAKLNPRVDVLVADVLSNIQNSEGGVRETLFVALKGIMKHSGSNVSQKAIIQTCNGAKEFLNAEEEMRILSARTLGIASQFLEEEDFSNLLKYVWKGIGDQDWRIRHGSSIATSSLLRFAPAKVSTKSSELSLLIYIIKACSKDDKMPVRECICKAVGRLGLAMVSQKSRIENFSASFSELVTALSFLLSDSSSDVRRRSLQAIKSISKACENPLIDHFKLLGPLISHGLKDSNSTVKSAAERTVFHFFKLCKSSENVQASQKFITGLEARRIAKLPELSDGSDDSEAEIDE